ncbi:hypothetical protein HA402_005636, partial [Bradysia odoriphaga]
FTTTEQKQFKNPKVCSCHFADKENGPTIRTPSRSRRKLNFDDSALKRKRNVKRKPLSEFCQNRNEVEPTVNDSLNDDMPVDPATKANLRFDHETPSDSYNSMRSMNDSLNDGMPVDPATEANLRFDHETPSDSYNSMRSMNDSLNDGMPVDPATEANLRFDHETPSDSYNSMRSMNDSLNDGMPVDPATEANLHFDHETQSDSFNSMLAAEVDNSHNKTLKEMEMLKNEIDSLKKTIENLTNPLINCNLRFEFKHIDYSDEKVYLHTGLPNKKVFDMLLKLLTRAPMQYYSNWTVKKLPVTEQLLMTLMKMKMNLKHFDLAQRFGCCTSTVTNVVRTWVLLMHEVLFVQLMKNVPSRKKNKTCLPQAFIVLCECRMVLDGVEFFCDKPFNMEKQKSAYSSYKHHCTCKALVGIAPNGFVTYVSELYPGSISDKKLVAHCGVLKHLVPGDMILADKGFLVEDILPFGVHLNIPPFLTTEQFTPEQVRQTERVARARVHVERAINKIKNFRILQYIPSELNGLASEIFQVNYG